MSSGGDIRREVNDLARRADSGEITPGQAQAEWDRLGEKYGPAPGDLAGAGGARATDPSTSARAAEQVTENAKGYREVALKAIYDARPFGLNAGELERATGIDGIWRRASELEQQGLIEAPGHERPSPKSGKANRVYVCTDTGEQLAREMA